MQEYAKDTGGSLQFATDSEFRMIPNWRTNEAAVRRKGYLPLVGTPEQREGYSATPSAWHVVQQFTTRIEPRREDPVTKKPFMEDIMEEDPETHEMKKVGERQVTREVPVEFDTSFIQVDSWEYQELPPEPEPKQPEDISDQLQQVINLIVFYCDKYGATEELLSLEDVNIATLTALIQKYEVTSEDQSAITNQILLIVLDIMGKLNATWYTIWNDTVKPALNHIHQTWSAAKGTK